VIYLVVRQKLAEIINLPSEPKMTYLKNTPPSFVKGRVNRSFWKNKCQKIEKTKRKSAGYKEGLEVSYRDLEKSFQNVGENTTYRRPRPVNVKIDREAKPVKEITDLEVTKVEARLNLNRKGFNTNRTVEPVVDSTISAIKFTCIDMRVSDTQVILENIDLLNIIREIYMGSNVETSWRLFTDRILSMTKAQQSFELLVLRMLYAEAYYIIDHNGRLVTASDSSNEQSFEFFGGIMEDLTGFLSLNLSQWKDFSRFLMSQEDLLSFHEELNEQDLAKSVDIDAETTLCYTSDCKTMGHSDDPSPLVRVGKVTQDFMSPTAIPRLPIYSLYEKNVILVCFKLNLTSFSKSGTLENFLKWKTTKFKTVVNKAQ